MNGEDHPLSKYLRWEIMPTTHCPGCGGGQVLRAFIQALDDLSIDPESLVAVTGIGCSSWITSPYLKSDTLHTTHGRAVAFATGVKVMKPESPVVVIAGDGDLSGIGGNHLIHAARRNIGLVVFLVNNFIYGMTGGQVSPTTPFGVATTTTPYFNAEHPLRIAELVAAAGANYVARWTTFHARQLIEAMKEALSVKGFAFVEIISQCPVSYGRRVGLRDGLAFYKHFKERSISVEDARSLPESELEGRFVVGALARRNRPEFTESLRRLNEEACRAG
ncbi:MAG: thiamine pyrophosphate-dependent enzyme [Planctomycetes bacterium]|jgi:2-oxoglutarate ferredoxin oxidoreductase subunit beta|nr:thiamine pyrophosphate-dependent enzyme [Planctomycetota bacterium]